MSNNMINLEELHTENRPVQTQLLFSTIEGKIITYKLQKKIIILC